MKRPLGIVNKNPLNIRYSPMNIWRGQTGSNKGFCVFSSFEFGYRAALVLLRNYISKGHVSISAIISRWAPSSENNTTAYIRYVVDHLHGYDDDVFKRLTTITDLTTLSDEDFRAVLFELIWSMSLYECGLTKGFDLTDDRLLLVQKLYASLHRVFEKEYSGMFKSIDLV